MLMALKYLYQHKLENSSSYKEVKSKLKQNQQTWVWSKIIV